MLDSFYYLQDLQAKKEESNNIKKEIPDFTEWCKEISPEYNWDMKWGKYIDEHFKNHRIKMLSLPPQVGKSTRETIHRGAYNLKFFSSSRGIIISYNLDITARFHREILSLLERAGVALYSKSQKEIVHENLRGSISFCGFNGGITSKPADWIIIDDPIRNAEDAYSENYQETLWSGFTTAIYPRLQEKFELYITHTRWHDNDLIGQILSKNEELSLNLDYKYINIPALCEDEENDPLDRKIGESIWPERFTAETLKTKMLLAQADGYALYQGRPSPPEGNIFKEADLTRGYFNELNLLPKNTIKFISVDCSFKDKKNSDYVAIIYFEYDAHSQNLFMIDIVNERLDFVGTQSKIMEFISRNRLDFALVEDKANGSAIINSLQRDFNYFIPIEPEGGKIPRAYAAQPFIKSGRLKVYKFINNFNDFVDQFKSFPASKNDDMIDALTQAINYLQREYAYPNSFHDISANIGKVRF